MKEMMKKVERRMNIYMAVTLSFFLSLIGTLSSGKFTIPSFLISFVISTIISFILGMFIPMRKIEEKACEKLKIKSKPLSLLFNSLISDCIYTPIMTLAMVSFAHRMATKQGANIPFLPMFLKSFVISMIAGYVIICIVTPIFLLLAMRDIPKGPNGPKGSGGPSK